jgi:hypothetical protein
MSETAKRFDDLPDETKELLSGLSPEDARTIKAGLPIVRAIIGFAKVTKWLVIVLLGILGGIVMLGESIGKIIIWFRG